MCVAISRAKYGLVVVGNSATMANAPNWNQVLAGCRKLGSVRAAKR